MKLIMRAPARKAAQARTTPGLSPTPPNTSSLSESSSPNIRSKASTSSARDQRAAERAEAKELKKAETERDAALAKQVALEDQIILLRSRLDKMEVSDENKHDTPPTTPQDSTRQPQRNAR